MTVEKNKPNAITTSSTENNIEAPLLAHTVVETTNETPTEANPNPESTENNDSSNDNIPPSNQQKNEEVLPWSQIAKKLLGQAAPSAIRGIFVAGRYFVVSILLARINEKLIAPNTLICLLESLQVVLGSRCLNSLNSEIGQLNGTITLQNRELYAQLRKLEAAAKQNSENFTLEQKEKINELFKKFEPENKTSVKNTNQKNEEQLPGKDILLEDALQIFKYLIPNDQRTSSVQADDINLTTNEDLEIKLLNFIHRNDANPKDKKFITKEDIGSAERQGTIFSIGLGAALLGMYYLANHEILRGVGQHEFAVEKAREYFQAAAPGIFALMPFTAQQRFFQAVTDSKAAMISSVLHSVLVSAISIPLMSKYEIAGAGYAFSIGTWATLIAHSIYMGLADYLKDYTFFQTKDTFNFKKIAHLAAIGIPSGIQCAMENAASITNSIFLGRVGGLDALSADQISLQPAQFISIANNGVGSAIGIWVSNSKGSNSYTNMQRYALMGMLMAVALPTIVFSLLLPLRNQYISLYINTDNAENNNIVNLAIPFLFFELLRQFATGLQVATASSLQGIKDTKAPMIATIAFAFFVNLAILIGLTRGKHFSDKAANSINASISNTTNEAILPEAEKTNLVIDYAVKAIGFFLAAKFNATRWHVKSEEIKGNKVCASLTSCFSSLFGQKELEYVAVDYDEEQTDHQTNHVQEAETTEPTTPTHC